MSLKFFNHPKIFGVAPKIFRIFSVCTKNLRFPINPGSIIPEEGWAWPCTSILLLVWQRLRPLGTFLRNAAHFTFSCLYDAKIDWGWHCRGLGESTLCMTLSDFSMDLYSTPIMCRNCSLISANSSALFATHSESIMIIILNSFVYY